MRRRRSPLASALLWAGFLFQGALALDNRMGLTPAMGFNPWNRFRCNITEALIKRTADRMGELQLIGLGYRFMVLDDCWGTGARNVRGQLVEDPSKFPSGMRALAGSLITKGMLFGIHASAGEKTCIGHPGSLGKEVDDAKTFYGWGVSYLKYNNCFHYGRPPQARYQAMLDAIHNQCRPVLFSMAEWGETNPGAWAGDIANSWRVSYNINASWPKIIEIIDTNARKWRYAGPGGFNDMDMLVVGNGGLTPAQERSHVTMWAALKSPLMISTDLSTISPASLALLTNKGMINVNQDPLGVQARRIWSDTDTDAVYAITTPCDDPNGGPGPVVRFDSASGRISNGQSQCLARVGTSMELVWVACGNNVVAQQWQVRGTKVVYRADPSVMLEVNNGTSFGDRGVKVQLSNVASGRPNQDWSFTNDFGRGPRLVNSWQQQCLAPDFDAPQGTTEVWQGPLTGWDTWVVVLFNRGSSPATISAHWRMLGLKQGVKYVVHNLWAGTKTSLVADNTAAVSTSVGVHDVAFYRIAPAWLERRPCGRDDDDDRNDNDPDRDGGGWNMPAPPPPPPRPWRKLTTNSRRRLLVENISLAG